MDHSRKVTLAQEVHEESAEEKVSTKVTTMTQTFSELLKKGSVKL